MLVRIFILQSLYFNNYFFKSSLKLAESAVSNINKEFLVTFLGNAPVGVYKNSENKVKITDLTEMIKLYVSLILLKFESLKTQQTNN